MSFRKTIFIFLLVVFSALIVKSQTITNYARTGARTIFEINWDADNYGDIQWQRSTNDGVTWNNIGGATKPIYDFTVSGDGLYRAEISRENCDPVYITHAVKVVDFSVTLLTVSENSALFEISNVDFSDANIVEYGFSYNLTELNTRNFQDMYRVQAGSTIPAGTEFEIECENLNPGTSYNVRVYFKTEDGSLIFGPGRIAVTLPGLKWTNEDWHITQTSVGAGFELSGFTDIMGNPNVEFRFGSSPDNLVSVNVIDLGEYRFTSEITEDLIPNTTYYAQAKATIEGETQILTKEVITLPDYSIVEPGTGNISITNTIRWDATQTMHRISPEGLKAEYPRIIRLNADTLLCAYHGGSANDYWVNIYLQKSFDNGRTWTVPTILMDKERSTIGTRYWRFANPEMIKLQNGWVLMSFIGNGNPETNNNCHVMVMISKDDGETWNDPVIVGRGRTWEPMVIQLPNGELEMLVASEAAWWTGGGTTNLHQEILVSRSTDNGETWTEFTRAAYSPGRRDGMPVAVVLQENKGVLLAIETVNDQGFGSPSLVHRSLYDEWDSMPWDGYSDDQRWNVNFNAHGGAPYIIQLPTGETVVTAHVNGRNGIWQTSYPRITIGDSNGKNFRTPVTPLTNLPSNQGAYYNSLFLKDAETVWLVVTHSLYDGSNRIKGEIKYLEGKIIKAQ